MSKLNLANRTPGASTAASTSNPDHPSEQGKQPVPAAFVPAAVTAQKRQVKVSKVRENKPPRVRGAQWFNENFDPGDGKTGWKNVLQYRMYPNRGAFNCAPCGIPGKNAYLIRAKEGKGNPIDISGAAGTNIANVTDAELKAGKVMGFLVGDTCLKRYSGLDWKAQPTEEAGQQPSKAQAAD